MNDDDYFSDFIRDDAEEMEVGLRILRYIDPALVKEDGTVGALPPQGDA